MDRAAAVDRPLRVGADHRDGAARRLLEVSARARDRAARADAGDEVGDLPVGVAPDLRAGRLVVPARTVEVRELVRLERAGDLAREPIGHAVVRARILRRHARRRHHDLGAVGLQHRDLLAGELVGHDEDHAVPALQGDEREAHAGVAARGLDDRAARFQQAVALGGVDDVPRDAILGRAAGVEVLDLREHRRVDAVGDGVERDERGVADEVGDVGCVTHDGCPDSDAARSEARTLSGSSKRAASAQRQQRQVRDTRPR